MKAKIFAILIVAAILFSAAGIDKTQAQAYYTNFTTSITYMNVGTAATTTLKLYFYATPDDTIPTEYTLANAAQYAAGSVYIGNITDIAAGFQGSAYLESDQMMQVTLVQLPDSTTVKNRALSNGFVAGGPTALIPTVLKGTYDTNSIFSVQNADTMVNNVSIVFKNLAAVTVLTVNEPIAPGAALYFDTGLEASLPAPFNGSVIIKAMREDGTTPGKVVATSMELSTIGTSVYSFEGFESGARTLYMPSAICAKWNATSFYAVQNTSLDTETDVTVTYTDAVTGLIYTAAAHILPGAKASFSGCGTTLTPAMPVNTYGAAVITSTAADVVAIGKVSGGGLSTAFNGVIVGSEVMGLPYVRWATDANYNKSLGQQRTNITIQNIGRPLVEDEPVLIEYYDYLGNKAGTHYWYAPAGGFPTGAKFNSSPALAGLLEFGFYFDPILQKIVYGGAAIVITPDGSEFTAVARVSQYVVYPTLAVAEDYNSQPIR